MAISWLGLLARLFPHADKLDDIGEQLRILFEAGATLRQRGEALSALIDLLIPILETVVPADAESEEAVVSALRLGDSKLLERLRKFYESDLGQSLIGLLLGQLLK